MSDEKQEPGDMPKAAPGVEDAGEPKKDQAEGEAPAVLERVVQARPPEKRQKGPLVVIKRAAPPAPVAPAPAAATEAAPEPAAEEAKAPAAPPAPAHVPDDSLYREVPEAQSFAEMFEEAEKTGKKEGSAGARRQPRMGEKVIGKIFQLGKDTAFVSLGGRTEAMIELRDLQDEEGILRFGVGDEIEAHVIQTGAKGILLTRSLGKGAATLGLLTEARHTGLPVEGMVLSARKGGLEVAIGDIRAFCPLSQIDVRFVEKPEQFVGEKLLFKVTEAKDGNIVVSRRAVVEEENKKKAFETRRNLTVGKVVRGTVTSVRDFGAFVDLGGVEGMIPVSEISHVRIAHPGDVLKASDEVEVEVIRIEPPQPNSPDKSKQKERITLSMRARQEDPWQVAARELKEGDRLKGKVVRLQPFGAFVELRPGVDGLLHVSALSDRRIAHPREVVKVNDEVEVQVEKVDPNEKRISLRLVKDGEVVGGDVATRAAEKAELEKAPKPRAGQVVTGKVDRIEPYGVFVKWPGGKGLIPASETGTQRGTDLKKAFKLDQEVKASILEVDGSGKIRLSITEAERAEERAAVSEWSRSQKGAGGKGFGTLGDLLKGKLGR